MCLFLLPYKEGIRHLSVCIHLKRVNALCYLLGGMSALLHGCPCTVAEQNSNAWVRYPRAIKTGESPLSAEYEFPNIFFFLAEKRTSNQTPCGLALPLRRIAGRERARKRWVKGRRTAFQPAALGDARQRSPLRGGRGAGGKAAQAGRPRAISWGEKVSSGSELPARRQRSSRGRRALPGFGTEQEKTNRCRASIQPRGGGIQTALSSGDLCRSNEPFFFLFTPLL